MKNLKGLLLAGIALAFALASCATAASPAAATAPHASAGAASPAVTAAAGPVATLAAGYWKEMCAMGFEISPDGKTYIEWDDAPGKVALFRGDILGEPDLKAASGLFYVKILESNSAAYPADAYTAIRWSAFDGTKVAKRVAGWDEKAPGFWASLETAKDAVAADSSGVLFTGACCATAKNLAR